MAEVTIPKKKWTSQSIFSLLWQLKRLRKRLEKIAKKCYQISYVPKRVKLYTIRRRDFGAMDRRILQNCIWKKSPTNNCSLRYISPF